MNRNTLAWTCMVLAIMATPAEAEAGAGPAGDGPSVVVLGTAQDGGVPQTACACDRCARARRDPALARRVASLAIDLPKAGRTYLIDATPDIAHQLEEIRTFRARPTGRTDRRPVDGVILTHAHVGHYLGLAQFGLESLNSNDLPLFVSPRLAGYLRSNGPWSQLVRLGNVAIREFEIGRPFPLEDGVTVTPVRVPHRDEFSDTMAFLVKGPRKSLFYVPDTDTWDTWTTPLPEVLKDVDYALLDATFYSADELPDRDITKIRHPLVTTSMDLLGPLVGKGRLQVWFTHLNHSNPALDRDGAARRNIETRGFHVLGEDDAFGL